MDAFIKAMRRAQGEFWVCCLSDEELMPGAITWAAENFIKHPDAAAIYGDYFSTDIMGNIMSDNKAQPWDFKSYLCCDLVPPFCSSFFKMSYFKTIHYDTYNDCGEYDIWLRLGVRYPIYYCEGFASKYASHEESHTSQVSDYYLTLPGRIRAVDSLLSQPGTPQDIVALREEAIAGIHLWMAQTFLGLEEFEAFEDIITKSLDYKPTEIRLRNTLISYINKMISIDKKDKAIHFIEKLMAGSNIAISHLNCNSNRAVNGITNDTNYISSEYDKLFAKWISTISEAENRLYYRDQTVASLGALVAAVRKYKPTKVVELGTLSGLSLRTWLSADPELSISAVDLSFDALHNSQRLIPLNLSRVTLVQQNILALDFSSLWAKDDRVLFYVDAHDDHGVPIMDRVLNTVLPALPRGSVIMVDDVWYSQTELNDTNVGTFFESVMLDEIDPLQCFDGYYAPYWKGGSFFGFLEVVPLLEWVNCNRIELVFRPGIKSVAFPWGGA